MARLYGERVRLLSLEAVLRVMLFDFYLTEVDPSKVSALKLRPAERVKNEGLRI